MDGGEQLITAIISLITAITIWLKLDGIKRSNQLTSIRSSITKLHKKINSLPCKQKDFIKTEKCNGDN